MKKLLSLLLVLAMVLGMGTAAFAAYPDSTGNKYEASILKVSQLGVFKGTDGKFNPNATITRAEFAAVMVRTLGLDAAATALAGTPTKFTDVPASHWASGYVNVAVAQGVVTGTSTTTFSPADPVTHAQVITMLVRAMNRDSLAKGEWPVGHIMVASQLNLMSGLTFNMNVPALRAEVAKYIDNSLTKSHLVLNAEGVLVADANVTFLSLLDATIETGIVSAVSTTNGTITIPAGTRYLATGAEIFGSTLANLVGQNVQLTLNDDGDVMFAKLYTTSQVVGKVTATDTVAKTITVNGTAYVVLNTANVTVNAATISGDALAKINAVKGADVVMVLDDAGKVSFIQATLLGTETKIIGKSTAVVGGKVYAAITVTGPTTINIDTTATIVRNGATATAADLKVGDSVKYALVSGLATYVDAYGTIITGVVAEKTTINGFPKIKIGTTVYDVAVDSNGDPDATAATAYAAATVGSYVNVTLDRTGKFTNIALAVGNTQVRTIAGTSAVWTSTGNAYTVSTTDGGTYTLDATVTLDGSDADITLNCANVGFAALEAGQKVILKFDGYGKVIAIDAFSEASITVSGIAGLVISGTDANSVAYAVTTVATTAFTVNNLPAVIGGIVATDSVSFVWDFTNWNATTHTGAVASAVNAKHFTQKGAIVGLSYDGTDYKVTVRVGTTDTAFDVLATSKIEIDGVAGKTWSDLTIGQKINLADTASDVTFAVVTKDATVPTLSGMGFTTPNVTGKLSEDAMVTVKVYTGAGTLVDTTDAFKVAKQSTAGAALIDATTALMKGATNLWTGLAAGSYSLVITAVDAAGNTSAPVQVTVTK